MAVLFYDSFSTYSASQVTTKWTNVGPGPASTFGSPGRFGTGQYAVVGTIYNIQRWQKVLVGAPFTTLTHGMAWLYDAAAFAPGSQSIHSWWDSVGNALGTLAVTASGQLAYYLGAGFGGTLVAISAPILSNLAWEYIEAQILFSTSASGTVVVKVNGATVINASSVITATNANGCTMIGPYTEQIVVGAQNATMFVGDYYVNGTGGTNAGFNGDGMVFPGMPTADGRVAAWSKFPNTGSNYQKINIIPPPGDTDYLFSSTVNQVNCNQITALPAGTTALLGVQVCASARKDNAASRSIELGVGNGSTETYGSGISLPTSYVYQLSPLDQNPLTGPADWAVVDWGTLQAAIKLSA